jgi:myo-inositol-1(or 4)-monophosphatase
MTPRYLDIAVRAARAAGALLREHFGRVATVNQATAHDIKLALDVEAQELIFAEIAASFPEHALYGEEGLGGNAASEFQWIVDPLDGTVNYFYGIPHFCVSVALRRGEKIIAGAIYDPLVDELWTAEDGAPPLRNGEPVHVSERTRLGDAVVIVGLSRTAENKSAAMPVMLDMIDRSRKCRFMGSAALAMAYVASGRVDAYMEPGISLWDIAAGILLVESAGGVVRLAPRGPETYSIVAMSGHTHEIAGCRWEGDRLIV